MDDVNLIYIFLEGKPLPENEESKEFGGAYINCWVNSIYEDNATDMAIEYVHDQGWKVQKILEIFVTNRERYVDQPDILECFSQAIKYGVGAIFYTWPR